MRIELSLMEVLKEILLILLLMLQHLLVYLFFDHGYYTGDAIYYTPQIINEIYVDTTSGTKLDNYVIKSELFPNSEGLYFVKRVDANSIKLAKSRSDLYFENYVTLDNVGIVTDNRIEPFSFHEETLQSQNL